MGKIIGIDLGTTNSAMAVMQSGKPEIIANSEGNRTTPSVVASNKNNERLVGQVARRQQVTNSKNTIYEVKRLIGRNFNDKEVQRDLKLMGYEIVKNGNSVKVKMGDKEHSPEEVSAMILSKLKADAESFLGESVSEAVITVPAYFDDSQRQATKDAGKIAGLEVKSTNGDTHLGGADFDRVIINYFADEFKKESGIDISEDKAAMQRLRDEAEKAKIELSTAQEININLPFLTADAEGPKHFEHKLTRAKLESLVADLIEKTEEPCVKALKDAKLKASDINAVVLVGGMTRMPAVQEMVKKIFGKEPMKGVNPDEVVAIGAAIQGGVLQGDVKDVLLLDVTPLSLGIETMGGVMTKLIERNTTIPTSKSEVFSTAADNQPQVEIHVGQGEREMIDGNKSLGRFVLDGIASAPRGVPQIEVTFNIDANGILNVTAKDKGTGKEQSITISGSGNLSKDDVEKMAKEAETHADEDKKRKEFVEAKNMLDSSVYNAEKMLKDNKDKLSDEDQKTLEKAIEEAKKSVADDKITKDDLDTALKDLNDRIMPIGSKMYESAKTEEDNKTEEKSDTVEGEVVDDKKEDK
ncbi:molecular chaperone DnaK [bacterium]|nr:molecular chaperone DnaK [bacterium]